jgi:hypothetical protein
MQRIVGSVKVQNNALALARDRPNPSSIKKRSIAAASGIVFL